MSISPSKIKILLVDDDYVDSECVKRSLKKLEVSNQLYIARDGLEALEMIYSNQQDLIFKGPTLMLLDINMPRMTGLELLEELEKRNDLDNFTVFMLTSSSLEEDIEQAYRYNIVAYIMKKNAGNSFIDAIELVKNYIKTVEFKSKESVQL
ncbi:response regulator [Vibrio comitans]|uniref:Response regulator n=1 Tax=Vibrio comitans NBRC 102076 TaxID=1219078 RepID=A0A4Y3IQY5_9VIBR|nr:response regulator [Vibrio comitans]GEA61949.1 response regulator [Vibrio comitans NBRC 102076]